MHNILTFKYFDMNLFNSASFINFYKYFDMNLLPTHILTPSS